MYCNSCGKEINKNSVFCNYCGGQIKTVKVEIVEKEVITPKDRTIVKNKKETLEPKSKTAAVLTAITLSFFSWLYTYKKNEKKFWLAFIPLLIIVLFMSLREYSAALPVGILPLLLIIDDILKIYLIITWLWAIIDNAVKPMSFYKKYPKG